MWRHLPVGPASAALLLSVLATSAAPAREPGDRASFEDALHRGRLADPERALGDTLNAEPGDDHARFALGVVQFLRAVEGRLQALHRHGCRTDPGGLVSFSSLPI